MNRELSVFGQCQVRDALSENTARYVIDVQVFPLHYLQGTGLVGQEAERRGSAAAERSEAVRWDRLLGASARFKLPADVYGQDLVFCIPLFCVIRSQIQI